MTQIWRQQYYEIVEQALYSAINDIRGVEGIPDRRERIATAAMQGLLAADARENSMSHQYDIASKPSEAAEIAVALADALITELDATTR